MAKTTAERKRDQRAREKAKASGSVGEATVHDFWHRNISVANPDRIAELRERQDYVIDLLSVMSDTMAGKRPIEWEDDATVNDDAQEDVTKYGECMMETVLLEFWKHPNTYQMLMNSEKSSAATKAFVRFGIVSGLPSHRLHEWDTWYASQQPATNPTTINYTTLQCTNHQICHTFPVAVQKEIADDYKKLGKPYLCHNCRDVESQSRSQASPRVTARPLSVGLLQGRKPSIESDPDQIFDSWGRVKS
jgi:hypothetical protein